MATIKLTLTAMANGGRALGRDDQNRVIFVPFAIPGEQAIVQITEDKKRYAQGLLVEILRPSPERASPRCSYFGPCGGCHFQHMTYSAQLRFKGEIVKDQLQRIGSLNPEVVRPVLASPEQWSYGIEAELFSAGDGEMGYWSFDQDRVIGIDDCSIIHPRLVDLLHDLDLVLPSLYKITLRIGSDASLLAAIETTDGEAPSLEADFPISVAMILPDGRAANLIGYNYLLQEIKNRPFRVSAGVFFYPNLPAVELLVDAVLKMAAVDPETPVLELYSGVGVFTAFLAERSAEVVAVEQNPDAVADAAYNLDNFNNVTLYQGAVEEILPLLEDLPTMAVVDPPPSGISPMTLDYINQSPVECLIYVSSDVATMARDGRRLREKGYALQDVQPLDMYPQTYRLVTVSRWVK